MTSQADYTLYYWSVPFRGHFIRAILAYAGKTVDEPDDGAIAKLMEKEPADQPYPFMGPPLLIDNADGSCLAQMPAIAAYLGDTLGLMPASAIDRARTLKTVNDANDCIDEMTMEGGSYKLWDEKLWKEFQPRLARWMAIFEATGAKYHLKADAGYLLGGSKPGMADVVAATLWGTMVERFPVVGKMLDEKAPAIAGLVKRVNEHPALRALAEQARERYGDQWCGGEIEKSLRKVAK